MHLTGGHAFYSLSTHSLQSHLPFKLQPRTMTVETQQEPMRHPCLALGFGSPPHTPCGACHLAGGQAEAQGESPSHDESVIERALPVSGHSHPRGPLTSSSSLSPSAWACVLGRPGRASRPTPGPSLGQDYLRRSLLIFFFASEILLFDTSLEPRSDNEPKSHPILPIKVTSKVQGTLEPHGG